MVGNTARKYKKAQTINLTQPLWRLVLIKVRAIGRLLCRKAHIRNDLDDSPLKAMNQGHLPFFYSFVEAKHFCPYRLICFAL